MNNTTISYDSTTSTTNTTTVPRFVRAVYDMLQNEDHRILSWSADGSYFQVYDVPRLEREVLSKYFKHSKLSSFQRQLNNFGFRKWTKTRASVATFSHDVLRQCHPSQLAALASQMKKKTPTATLTPTKRRQSDVAATADTTAPAKKQKMSPIDTSSIEELEQDACAAIFQSVWEQGHCDSDASLLDALDSVELLELDWDAAISSVEAGDSECASLRLLRDEDVSAVLGDLKSAKVLSDDELDVLLGDDWNVYGVCDDDLFAAKTRQRSGAAAGPLSIARYAATTCSV